MGIFEEAAVKAKEVFDIAGKKTEEIVSLQKLRYRLASLKAQLNRDLQLLGSLQYDLTKNSEPVETLIADQILKIDEVKQEIRAIKLEIARQKGQVICPACKTGQPGDAAFCNRCGAKLPKEPPASSAAAQEAPEEPFAQEAPIPGENAADSDV